MPACVTYVRVSTQQQGRSGLGLEAQQTTIAAFLSLHGFECAAEYRDVESGSHDARPALQKSLAHARRLKCPVIVAKLARADNSPFSEGISSIRAWRRR